MSKKQLINKKEFKNISDGITERYKNFILENINDHCLRIAVMTGEYKWHYHNYTDELFIVLEGELKIEFKNAEPVFLQPGAFIKIPAKTIHKTSADTRTVNITFEKKDEDTIFTE